MGMDLDSQMIEQGKDYCENQIHLQTQNVLDYELDQRFDLIILRDVIEHIPQYPRVLEKTLELLNPEGLVYMTYTPWRSPFGGHQQHSRLPFKLLPWVHLLPQRFVLKRLQLPGNLYKETQALEDDINSVFQTRLSAKKITRWIELSPLEIRSKRFWVVRPEYRLKFDLPIPSFGFRNQRIWSSFFIQSEEWVLQKIQQEEPANASVR